MSFSFRIKLNSLTFLVCFNVILFLLPTVLTLLIFKTDIQGGYYLFLNLLGSLHPSQVFQDFQLYRIITSAFLHVDLIHLIANMLGLYQLGRIVNMFYGGRQLFSFYIITGIAGSLVSLIFLGNIATVGASGAVFGLIGVLLGGSLKKNTYGIDLPFRPLDILPIVAYAFLIGLMPGLPVNNWAHLGGFLAGVVLGRVFDNKLTVWRPQLLKKAENVVFFIMVGLLITAYVWMLFTLPATLAL